MFVERYLSFFKVGGLVFFGIAVDDFLILAMGSDEHVGAAEDVPQAIHTVYQHVARA